MGASSSKSKADQNNSVSKGKHDDFVQKIRSSVEDEIARKLMLQREVQLAVSIAKARDTIWIFGSAWATLVSGISAAKLMGKPVPHVAAIPVVIGGLALGNMADMAYGNKLNRVVKEAEHLMANERGRFVPFAQAPFFKFYSNEEREGWYDHATPVGELFPNRLIARRNIDSTPVNSGT